MKWDDYEAFCRVAEHGGFTAAARSMRVPKSSLSASVARLEASLNVRLLKRSTRAVRLTEEGKLLYGGMLPLFEQLRKLHDQATSYSDEVSGTLRVAAPYEFSVHHLGLVACRIMQQYPELMIEIDMWSAEINTRTESYDVVLSMVDRGLPSSSLIARRVLSLEQGLYASPSALSSFGEPSDVYQITRMPIIAASTDTEWNFRGPDGAPISVALPPPRLRTSNAGVRRQAGIAGLGIIRITSTYCEEAVRSGQLVRLLPAYSCAPLMVFASFPSRRFMPARVRMFLDALNLPGLVDK